MLAPKAACWAEIFLRLVVIALSAVVTAMAELLRQSTGRYQGPGLLAGITTMLYTLLVILRPIWVVIGRRKAENLSSTGEPVCIGILDLIVAAGNAVACVFMSIAISWNRTEGGDRGPREGDDDIQTALYVHAALAAMQGIVAISLWVQGCIIKSRTRKKQQVYYVPSNYVQMQGQQGQPQGQPQGQSHVQTVA